MLALTERAQVYRYTGQRGGRPAYAATGLSVRCRIQPGDAQAATARGLARAGTATVYAEAANVRAGDRLVTADGESLVVTGVREARGLRGAHHLEITAQREGG